MSRAQTVKDYFSDLDSGEADKAAAMFEPGGRVDAPWAAAIDPRAFVQQHIESAPVRRHTIIDVLLSENGQSAAVQFAYDATDPSGAAKPTFVGCDHFTFGPGGGIKVLSIYVHQQPSP